MSLLFLRATAFCVGDTNDTVKSFESEIHLYEWLLSLKSNSRVFHLYSIAPMQLAFPDILRFPLKSASAACALLLFAVSQVSAQDVANPDALLGYWCTDLRGYTAYIKVEKKADGSLENTSSHQGTVRTMTGSYKGMENGKHQFSAGNLQSEVEVVDANNILVSNKSDPGNVQKQRRCKESEAFFSKPAGERPKQVGEVFEYKEYNWRIVTKTAGNVVISSTGLPSQQIATEAADLLCGETGRVAQFVSRQLILFTLNHFNFNCTR